jgi:hypothetical protein
MTMKLSRWYEQDNYLQRFNRFNFYLNPVLFWMRYNCVGQNPPLLKDHFHLNRDVVTKQCAYFFRYCGVPLTIYLETCFDP